MKPLSLLSLLIPLAASGCAKSVARSLPKVAIPEDPAPAPWTPLKTSLSKETLDEAAFLLAHGMGDPRGGDYRAAKVVVGTVWGRDAAPSEIHGWVSKDAKRVVAPNGLVYDAVSVGAKADLKADVGAEIERWRAVKGPRMRFTNPRGPLWGPLGVRLLLVSGDVDLAQRFATVLPGDPNRVRSAVLNEFLANLFDQAVTAHMRGNDATALRVGRKLVQVRPAFEARALALNGQQYATGPSGQPLKTDEQFAFLAPVPELVADAERRLSNPHRGAFDPKTASVAALIDRLDEVSARQWGQPGGVNLVDDPIVAALAAKGGEAAEPLLDAMERDDRLTRSVSFARDFFPARNLIPVRQAALAAFQAFAQTDKFPAGAFTKLDVPALRAYWSANKGKTGPERWFDTLADDRAGWRRWEEAATRLFDKEGVVRNGYTTMTPAQTGGLKAEGVRGRTNPSLSDLLERRAHDVVERNDEGLGGPLMLTTSLRMGLDLARWDPPRSVALLHDLTRQSIAALGAQRMDVDYAGTFVVPAIKARAAAGDPTAWTDYRELLASVKRFPSFDSKLLKPLVDHPDVPEVREATKLLTTPGSIYDAVGRIVAEPRIAGYDSILVSPLLGLSSVREAVLKGLVDRTTIGAAWIDDRGNAWVEANGKSGAAQGTWPDPGEPKPPSGQKRPLRAADAIAHALARLKGAPGFQPYWTVAQKDAAIARMRTFLVQNAGHIDAIVPWPNNWRESAFENVPKR